MLRRMLLTAAVAVAFALVVPSTSQADFQVSVAGVSGQVGGGLLQVGVTSGSAGNGSNTYLTSGDTLGGLPFGSVVGSNITSTQGGTQTQGNTTLKFGDIASGGNLFTTQTGVSGLLGTSFATVPGGQSQVYAQAGVYIGASLSQTTTLSSANLNTTTGNVQVFNDTGATETLNISVSNTFYGPGTSPSLIGVTQGLTLDSFTDITGAVSTNSIDSIYAVGQGNGGAATTGATTNPLTNASGINAAAPNTHFIVNWISGQPYYTLVQTFTITLASGDSVQFQGKLDGALLYTPAPGGLILAVAGIPFLGLLRRRMARVVPTVA